MDPNAQIQEKNKPENAIVRQIGVVGSVVTILLTLYNTFVIETQQNSLKELEIKLQERATGLDESRERVDRYKWVLSLFPALEDTDAVSINKGRSATAIYWVPNISG